MDLKIESALAWMQFGMESQRITDDMFDHEKGRMELAAYRNFRASATDPYITKLFIDNATSKIAWVKTVYDAELAKRAALPTSQARFEAARAAYGAYVARLKDQQSDALDVVLRSLYHNRRAQLIVKLAIDRPAAELDNALGPDEPAARAYMEQRVRAVAPPPWKMTDDDARAIANSALVAYLWRRTKAAETLVYADVLQLEPVGTGEAAFVTAVLERLLRGGFGAAYYALPKVAHAVVFKETIVAGEKMPGLGTVYGRAGIERFYPSEKLSKYQRLSILSYTGRNLTFIINEFERDPDTRLAHFFLCMTTDLHQLETLGMLRRREVRRALCTATYVGPAAYAGLHPYPPEILAQMERPDPDDDAYTNPAEEFLTFPIEGTLYPWYNRWCFPEADYDGVQWQAVYRLYNTDRHILVGRNGGRLPDANATAAEAEKTYREDFRGYECVLENVFYTGEIEHNGLEYLGKPDVAPWIEDVQLPYLIVDSPTGEKRLAMLDEEGGAVNVEFPANINGLGAAALERERWTALACVDGRVFALAERDARGQVRRTPLAVDLWGARRARAPIEARGMLPFGPSSGLRLVQVL